MTTKRVLNTAAGEDIEWAERTGTAPAFSEAVAVDLPGATRVFVSGIVTDDPDLGMKDQTRDVLAQIEAALDQYGGDMTDVVRVRVYVDAPALTEANFQAIHEARGEFFEPEHFPASTLVEVSNLIRDGVLVEIDAEAVIPTDDWDVEVLAPG